MYLHLMTARESEGPIGLDDRNNQRDSNASCR